MLILYLGNFNLEHKFVVLVDQRFNLENEQGEAVVYVIELYAKGMVCLTFSCLQKDNTRLYLLVRAVF